jgi:hypothetical protein
MNPLMRPVSVSFETAYQQKCGGSLNREDSMPIIKLREGGIYCLPDKREFIVCASGDESGYLFYNPAAWRRYGMAEYRSQLNGRILNKGFVTRWRVEDLRDTGRTIEYSPPSSNAA